MGNAKSNILENTDIDFEDMKYSIEHGYTILTTIPIDDSHNLIKSTKSPSCEEEYINNLIEKNELIDRVVIYGKNSNDKKIYKKYNDLKNFGFIHVFIYVGGMFEWMLLQDIYGTDNFPTTQSELDILKFKPPSIINTVKLLE